MTLRSVFHRKTRGSDSDSTGYSSSSSIASSPLSASQFILRPHTVLSSYSNHSANEKFLFDPYSTPPSWDNSSRSSRTSSENSCASQAVLVSELQCIQKIFEKQ
ncbi:hypothetical protein Q1695_007254 [Nippostrongylus brasiliensis]|nr:hypothetical protein Q1695_007254 [Nippostrongylus brasiliensis]